MPTFTFHIDENGTFTYDPPNSDWKYRFGDELIFKTTGAGAGAGHFRITFIHTHGYAQLPRWPPGPLESTKDSPYEVKVKVRDGLSEKERKSIQEGNRSVDPDSRDSHHGFIGKYKYKVEILEGSKYTDDQHNGQYDC